MAKSSSSLYDPDPVYKVNSLWAGSWGTCACLPFSVSDPGLAVPPCGNPCLEVDALDLHPCVECYCEFLSPAVPPSGGMLSPAWELRGTPRRAVVASDLCPLPS